MLRVFETKLLRLATAVAGVSPQWAGVTGYAVCV